MMYGLIKARVIKATGPNWSSRPNPWVARLTALDERWGFCRDFVKGVWDYTYATKKGKNVVIYFALAPGLYEVYYPTSWKHEERYFARVDDNGDVHRISREEAVECLKNDT